MMNKNNGPNIRWISYPAGIGGLLGAAMGGTFLGFIGAIIGGVIGAVVFGYIALYLVNLFWRKK